MPHKVIPVNLGNIEEPCRFMNTATPPEVRIQIWLLLAAQTTYGTEHHYH